MHGRILHDTPTGDNGFAFRLPDKNKPGAELYLDLELDQRLLLHGERLHRVRDLRQGRDVSDRDDFLLGQLHREWRISHVSGHCDRQFPQNMPKKTLLASADGMLRRTRVLGHLQHLARERDVAPLGSNAGSAGGSLKEHVANL
jgi:hypothetical protein